MTAFGRLLGLEQRAGLPVPFDGSALQLPSPSGGGAGSVTGRPVDSNTALSIGVFFRGVQLIADSISFLPLGAVKQRADGTRQPLAQKPGLITDPFAGCSLQQGVSQIITSLILRGNAYLFPGTVVAGEVVQWRILPPDAVQIRDGSYWVGQQKFDPPYVTHLTAFQLPGSNMGLSLIECCRNTIGLATALTDTAGTFFANGIMSSGVLSMDAPMTNDVAKQTAEMFRQNHAGVRNAHIPIVLGGGAKYTSMTMNPDDAQFIESRQFQQGEIASILGIPPHLLGIVDRTTSWGTGIEVQGRAYVDYTLRPTIQRLQTMFTGWLEPGVYAEYDTDALTRADTATRYQNYAVALGSTNGVGWLNVDEVRAMEGRPALPDKLGQTYWSPSVMVSEGSAAPAATPTENPNTDTTVPTAANGAA